MVSLNLAHPVVISEHASRSRNSRPIGIHFTMRYTVVSSVCLSIKVKLLLCAVEIKNAFLTSFFKRYFLLIKKRWETVPSVTICS